MLKAIFQFLNELYLTCFTLFFRVGIYRWPLHVEFSKAAALVTLIEWFILLEIASWIDICLGTRFLLNVGKWVAVTAFLALCFPNYYVLVIRGHGVRFEREFNKLEKSRKNLLVASFIMMMLAVIAFFIYTKSTYQSFFHIIPKSGF